MARIFYYALKNAGGKKYNVSTIKNRKLQGESFEKTVTKADVIFICVQDSNIPVVVNSLSKHSVNLKGKYIFHTSGTLTSDTLAILAGRGALTASFHPVQTFEQSAKKHAGRFSGIYIAIEGNKKAIIKATAVSTLIKAKTFIIKKENKVYHHICCVMASNYLAVLNGMIEKTGSKKIRINGFNKLKFFNIYMPLAKQTLDNISALGPKAALTGPVERNDVLTIESHLKALKRAGKDILFYYVLMGIETVKLALEKKSITGQEADKIYKLFSKFIKLQ